MKLTTDTHIKALLPANLKILRRRKGMTQVQYASFVSLRMKSYAKYEEGLASPKIAACLAICSYEGITLDALLTTKIK